jgi:hypothetical protein
MSGQPLTSFKDFGSLTFHPGSVFKRPGLAPHIMLVIEIWSLAESSIFKMVTDCLRSEPMIAAAMLQAVDNQAARRAIILAAAKAVLSESDWPLFEAGFLSTSPSRNIRHAFVHHLWGLATGLPDALLLFDPKYAGLEHTARVFRFRERVKSGIPPSFAGETSIDPAGIWVWRERDFKAEVESAKRCSQVIADIWRLLDPAIGSNDSTRQRLLNDPLIQQRLGNRK